MFLSHRILSYLIVFFFFLLLRPPPRSTLFPYTTLFRSKTVNVEGQLMVLMANRYILPAALDYQKRVAESVARSEEHTSELQSLTNLVCRLLLEKKKKKKKLTNTQIKDTCKT